MKFKLTFDRLLFQVATVIIDADNEVEAERLALEQVDYREIDWQECQMKWEDSEPEGNPYVIDITSCEDEEDEND